MGGGPPANIDEYDQNLVEGIINCTIQNRKSETGFYEHTDDELLSAEAGSDWDQDDCGIAEDGPAISTSPRSLLAGGLYVRQQTIAAVVMQRKKQNPFTTQEAKLLTSLSDPLARAIGVALHLKSTDVD